VRFKRGQPCRALDILTVHLLCQQRPKSRLENEPGYDCQYEYPNSGIKTCLSFTSCNKHAHVTSLYHRLVRLLGTNQHECELRHRHRALKWSASASLPFSRSILCNPEFQTIHIIKRRHRRNRVRKESQLILHKTCVPTLWLYDGGNMANAKSSKNKIVAMYFLRGLLQNLIRHENFRSQEKGPLWRPTFMRMWAGWSYPRITPGCGINIYGSSHEVRCFKGTGGTAYCLAKCDLSQIKQAIHNPAMTVLRCEFPCYYFLVIYHRLCLV
jgi:hypothetical protein